MRRWFPILLLASLALILLAVGDVPPSLAGGKGKKAPDPIDPVGEPKGFKAGDSARYALWHDKKGWHLRTTTAQKKHHFVGSIQVEGGKFEKVASATLEATGQLQDHWRVDEPARKGLLFDFKTEKGMDGINFQVSKDAKQIRFNLLLDGKNQPERIFIGADNDHPRNDPFALPAHPAQKAGKKKALEE